MLQDIPRKRADAHNGRTTMRATIETGAYKIFNTEAAAITAVAALGFDDGELAVCVDPNGSGRCFIEVLDLDDGAVIGRI